MYQHLFQPECKIAGAYGSSAGRGGGGGSDAGFQSKSYHRTGNQASRGGNVSHYDDATRHARRLRNLFTARRGHLRSSAASGLHHGVC